MKKSAMSMIIIAVAAFILINMAVYTVDETKQAIVLRFQEIVRLVPEPGIHLKLPFVESVGIFEKRLLEYDAAPKDIITQDKKTLRVDNFARWKIIDLKTFYERVRNENAAQLRLDEIIYSDLRNELGKYTFIEIIRDKRQEIMDQVTTLSNAQCADFGIEIVDVRIKRADLPDENESAVFERMRTERKRQADLYRSEGEEEAIKIRSETDKQSTIIRATAYQESEKLRGEGDAEALKIYANAYNRDPEFYQFFKSLEAYETTLISGTTLVIPPDSEFLKYLMKIR
ncbi:protease modulator HflC [candidate division KSB1 bacterium]